MGAETPGYDVARFARRPAVTPDSMDAQESAYQRALLDASLLDPKGQALARLEREALDQPQDALEDQAARVQALTTALQAYGRHYGWCAYWKPIPEGKIALPCDCGLEAALATPTPPAATHGAEGLCDATCSACGTANTYRSGGCYPKWCGGCGAVLLAAPPAPAEAGEPRTTHPDVCARHGVALAYVMERGSVQPAACPACRAEGERAAGAPAREGCVRQSIRRPCQVAACREAGECQGERPEVSDAR